MIEICNLRYENIKFDYDIKVDRSSILGNKFYMHNESERNIVCDKYELYFKEQLSRNKAFVNELRRLYKIYKTYGKLRLFCWCYPKRCHAETIKKFLEKYINK
jgi:hypothetical protein